MRLLDYDLAAFHAGVQVDDSVQYFGHTGTVTVGEGSRIDFGCVLLGNIIIGRRVHIPPYCLLYGAYGITIGDLVNFGAGCILHTESESFTGAHLMGPLVPEHLRKPRRHAIKIGNVVTVGVRSTILPGAVLEDGVMIGVHSLVLGRTYMRCGMYAGNPAEWVRQGSDKCLEMAEEVLK